MKEKVIIKGGGKGEKKKDIFKKMKNERKRNLQKRKKF